MKDEDGSGQASRVTDALLDRPVRGGCFCLASYQSHVEVAVFDAELRLSHKD